MKTSQHLNDQVTLDWINVLEASSFVLLAVFISAIMGIKLEYSLIVASIRCVVQLMIMGYVLEDVFHSNNVYIVLLLSLILVLLGTYELVYHRTKKTFKGLFVIMFVILFTSNCIISYVGIVYVLQRTPFWEPTLFIPIIGMLLGNTMGSVVMATERCLDQISTHAALLETRLAYGATRYEAGLPLAIEIMRMAMLPVLTQLSVMGMINIPGMMTGQIMAGTPIHEAVMYQQCIMFMVAASSTFGVMMTVGACMMVLIDKQQVLRLDRIIDTGSFVSRIPFISKRVSLEKMSRILFCVRVCLPDILWKRRQKVKYEEVEM